MNKAYILLCFFIFYSCSWGTHDTPASLRPYSNASLICNIAPASNSYGFLFYSPADWEAIISCHPGEVGMLERPSVYPQSGLGSSSLQSVNFTVVNRNKKCSDFGKKNYSGNGNSLCSNFGNNSAVTVVLN